MRRERLCDRVAIMDHGKVIALGTPQQLIATLGGEDIVEFAVDGTARVDVAALTAIEGVQSHRVDAGLHQLSVSGLHRAMPLDLCGADQRGVAPERISDALGDA